MLFCATGRHASKLCHSCALLCCIWKNGNSILNSGPFCKGHVNNPEAPTQGVKLASENINRFHSQEGAHFGFSVVLRGSTLVRKRKSGLRFDCHLSYSEEEEQPRWVMMNALCCDFVGIAIYFAACYTVGFKQLPASLCVSLNMEFQLRYYLPS